MKKNSTVVNMIKLVYVHACETKTFSWQALNSALELTLWIAINRGIRFEKTDFSILSQRFKSEFWIGDEEHAYCGVIDSGNISAAISFEHYKGRKPFIFDKVIHSNNNSIVKKRLSVGQMFFWDGVIATVTSFNDDKGYLTACTYKHDDKEKHSTSKVKNRYKITNADLKGARNG